VTFTVYVARDRWRAHQRSVLEDLPGLVPVAKGNGYGVGNGRLAEEAALLGVDTIAVGTEREVAEVSDAFAGDVLVMTPVLPGASYDVDPRVIRTVAHRGSVEALPAGARVVLECRTSMHRHGVRPEDLLDVAGSTGAQAVAGLALHFPLDRPGAVDPVAETDLWVGRLAASGLGTTTLWVSHLDAAELAGLRSRRSPSGLASAPGSGWATGMRCRRVARSSTWSRSRGASEAATASTGPPRAGISSSYPAGRRTGWRWRRRRRSVAPCRG
jgi:Alanine racemase, N-terminal domain